MKRTNIILLTIIFSDNIDFEYDYEFNFSHQGVFVFLSLCNHSCEPTAFVTTSDPISICLNASKDRMIKKGEALTISYASPDMSRAEKQKTFKHWHFDCKCARCVMEAAVEEVKASPSTEAASRLQGKGEASPQGQGEAVPRATKELSPSTEGAGAGSEEAGSEDVSPPPAKKQKTGD